MITRNCKHCKISFYTYPSRIKTKRGVFCSVPCFNIAQKGKLPWNTGKKSIKLSLSKRGFKNPMWKGGISKKESDKKYSKTPSGIASHRTARLKWARDPKNREYQKLWTRRRLITDIHFKLKRRISNAVWCKLVRNRKQKKDNEISKCLPYSINDLKKHLESLFLPGMNWNNYGEWHIDHVIPDSFFKYLSTEDKEFLESWKLTNLQPMWAVDNLRKGRKLDK